VKGDNHRDSFLTPNNAIMIAPLMKMNVKNTTFPQPSCGSATESDRLVAKRAAI